MDAWTEEQIAKMKAGGNNRTNVFLKECGVEKSTPHVQKYNSKAAAVRMPALQHSQGSRASHAGRCANSSLC
jgi:hypothetical protein